MNVKEIISAHNDSIDNYININLSKILNAKDGKINLTQWFEAQELIRQQNFYEKGRKIQIELRAAGYDVKMNMQSYKLVF